MAKEESLMRKHYEWCWIVRQKLTPDNFIYIFLLRFSFKEWKKLSLKRESVSRSAELLFPKQCAFHWDLLLAQRNENKEQKKVVFVLIMIHRYRMWTKKIWWNKMKCVGAKWSENLSWHSLYSSFHNWIHF